ncbi:hypothetical protein ILYODFUR_011517 [Ilyodon furcidens]|uniref:Uncharacterized protein n=1 Tax=Ilyodon furcidens TaxID=33524 RepID=A0ABV0SL13_9TELE
MYPEDVHFESAVSLPQVCVDVRGLKYARLWEPLKWTAESQWIWKSDTARSLAKVIPQRNTKQTNSNKPNNVRLTTLLAFCPFKNLLTFQQIYDIFSVQVK